MMGYTDGARLPGQGLLLWNDDRPEMGIHVELPSKCIKLLNVDAVQLCGWVALREGKATRVDVAIDTDSVHMATIVQAQESGDLVSRAQDRRLIYNYRDGSQTLYVGSPKSRRLVRFYDKALEQESKTGEVYDGVWTRCEV
jgi:DNA relaxase NicK